MLKEKMFIEHSLDLSYNVIRILELLSIIQHLLDFTDFLISTTIDIYAFTVIAEKFRMCLAACYQK